MVGNPLMRYLLMTAFILLTGCMEEPISQQHAMERQCIEHGVEPATEAFAVCLKAVELKWFGN